MSLPAVHNPFDVYLDLAGRPLNGGRLYIGVDGQDPETNPQAAFWDAAGTIPALQPIDVLGGYPMRLGTPARIYTADTCSLRVRDRFGAQVYYVASAAEPAKTAADINYTAPGGQTRTISSKLNETISVLDFVPTNLHAAIANGSSTADVTAYFVNAVAASVGQRLYAPRGLYNVSSIVLTGDFWLYGDGEDTIIKQIAGSTADLFGTLTTGVSIVMRDLTLDGNWTNQTAYINTRLIALAAGGASDTDPLEVDVEGVTFRSPNQAAIYFAGDNVETTRESLRVVNCRFFGGSDTPTVPTTPWSYITVAEGAYVYVSNCVLDYGSTPTYGRTGIFLGQVNTSSARYKRVTIRDCTFRRLGSNISAGTGAIDLYIWCEEAVVSGNRFEDSSYAPLRMKSNSRKVIIEDNTFSGVRADLPAFSMSQATYATATDGVVFRNNIVSGLTGSPQYAIAFDHYYDVDHDAVQELTDVFGQGLLIEGNILLDVIGSGIYCVAGLNGKVRGNYVTGAGAAGAGINLQKGCIGAWEVSDNTVSGGAGIDIYVDGQGIGTDVLIEGNICRESSYNNYSVYVTAARVASIVGNMALNVGAAFGTGAVTTLKLADNLARGASAGTGYGPGAIGPAAVGTLHLHDNMTDATTAVTFGTVTNLYERGNTWNKREKYASAAPVSGAYSVGDVVWNTAPTAGGNIGWVCTTAGSPGTWKTFGAVAA